MRLLTCTVCLGPFRRAGTRGPIPKHCGQRCKARAKRTEQRRAWEREYRRARRAVGLDLADNVARRDYFRERWRRLFGDPEVELPAPYTGHRWLDMARQAVNGGRDVDPAFRDFGYTDEVGEALLALLEGRDMQEALHEHRRREYVPRHLTVFTSEWHDDGNQERLEDRYMPTSPSAEDEAIARIELTVKERYHHGKNRFRGSQAPRGGRDARRRAA